MWKTDVLYLLHKRRLFVFYFSTISIYITPVIFNRNSHKLCSITNFNFQHFYPTKFALCSFTEYNIIIPPERKQRKWNAQQAKR